MSRVRGDISHKVPANLRDPGDYERGEVVNGGQGSPPEQPGREWAGNSPGWQGMPLPLGSSRRDGQDGEFSHASEGRPSGGSAAIARNKRHSPDHEGKWAGDLGEPNDLQDQLSGNEPITPTIKGSFEK